MPPRKLSINPLLRPKVREALLAGRSVPEEWREQIKALSPLAKLTGLTHLNLSGTGVTDVTALAGLTKLMHLDLNGTRVTDVAVLAGLTELMKLDLGETGVTDVTALAGLTKLTVLYLSGIGVTDVTALAGLTALTVLCLSGTGVTDVAALAGLTALTHLDLDETGVADVAALAGLNELTILRLSGTGVTDITALAGLTKLKVLHLSGTGVTDVTALAGLTKLTVLRLNETGVTDITALAGLNELGHLDLSGTDVADVGALAGLTKLMHLDLSGTGVTNVAALAHLTTLKIIGLEDAKPSSPRPPAAPLRTEGGAVPVQDGVSSCRLPDRFKLRFDDAGWLEKALAEQNAGFHVTSVSQGFGFIAVAKPPDVSEDRFRGALDALCAHHGGRLAPEFGYDLDEDLGFDSSFAPALNAPGAGEMAHTLADVLGRNKARGLHNHSSADVIIAVVDTGIEGSRPEFRGGHRRAGGWAARGEEPWVDAHGHGTMCASIAAGVAPHSPLLACRSLDLTAGKPRLVDTDLVRIYEKLAALARDGKKVVASNSFGIASGTAPGDDPDVYFPTALAMAIDAGVHVVFSAGNYHTLAGGAAGHCSPNSIWQYKGWAEVLTVGACDLQGRMWDYSSRGPGHDFSYRPDVDKPEILYLPARSDKPDVVAPVPHRGRIPRGKDDMIGPWGTSGAAPQVAGLLALLWAGQPDNLPRNHLYDLVRLAAEKLKGYGPYCQGYGMIDCAGSLERAAHRGWRPCP